MLMGVLWVLQAPTWRLSIHFMQATKCGCPTVEVVDFHVEVEEFAEELEHTWLIYFII